MKNRGGRGCFASVLFKKVPDIYGSMPRGKGQTATSTGQRDGYTSRTCGEPLIKDIGLRRAFSNI